MQPTPHIEFPSNSDHRGALRDRRGLPLTTASTAAAACYRGAIDCIHGGEAGAAELLDQAIASDPTFALAHAARWMLADSERDAPVSRVARSTALSLCDGVTARERAHIEALAAMIDRQPDASESARRHLSAYPEDLLVASQLVGHLFFHGGVGKRAAVVDLLQGLAVHHGDDWAFTSRLGFHMSELGRFDGAIPLIESALQARPQAPFVAHAMAHALLESGERMASHRFLRDWVALHDPTGPLDGHIHWHLSLGELECGQPAAAVQRYLRSTAPGSSHCAAGLQLADAGGLFCRMLLDAAPLDDMPRAPLRRFVASLGGALSMPFVAVHAAALAVVLGDHDMLDRCVAATERAGGGGDGAAESLVLRAFRAYAAGDMRACIDALRPHRAGTWEAIGGSNEERALIAKLHASAQSRLARA